MAKFDFDGKVTSDLATLVNETDEDSLIDVVVELESGFRDSLTIGGDRRLAMEQLRERFDELAEPVARVITSSGGELLGAAWINGTLRARVPVSSIPEISDEESVATVDIPHVLEAEA